MRQSLRLLLTLCLMVPLTATCDKGEAQASVRGTAFYHETIDLPPGAVFEATLADVARADAPAVPLGRAILDGRSGPPFAFTIPYDPARIEPRGRYVVRATITLDGPAPLYLRHGAFRDQRWPSRHGPDPPAVSRPASWPAPAGHIPWRPVLRRLPRGALPPGPMGGQRLSSASAVA